MSFLKRDEGARLRKTLVDYEKRSAQVMQDGRRQRMIDAIEQAWGELEQNNIRKARVFLNEARHHFLRARLDNQVFYYKNVFGLLISALHLIALCSIVFLAKWYAPIKEDAIAFPTLIALAGGGFGGVTAVLSKLVGISPQTKAQTNRATWYLVKPTLGAIMGFVTYFALVSGISLISSTYQVNNEHGVFIIGFLGGYLERFSIRILDELADRVATSEQIEVTLADQQNDEEKTGHAKNDSQISE